MIGTLRRNHEAAWNMCFLHHTWGFFSLPAMSIFGRVKGSKSQLKNGISSCNLAGILVNVTQGDDSTMASYHYPVWRYLFEMERLDTLCQFTHRKRLNLYYIQKNCTLYSGVFSFMLLTSKVFLGVPWFLPSTRGKSFQEPYLLGKVKTTWTRQGVRRLKPKHGKWKSGSTYTSRRTSMAPFSFEGGRVRFPNLLHSNMLHSGKLT